MIPGNLGSNRGLVYEASIDRPHGFAAIEIKHVASYFRVAYYLPAVARHEARGLGSVEME